MGFGLMVQLLLTRTVFYEASKSRKKIREFVAKFFIHHITLRNKKFPSRQ